MGGKRAGCEVSLPAGGTTPSAAAATYNLRRTAWPMGSIRAREELGSGTNAQEIYGFNISSKGLSFGINGVITAVVMARALLLAGSRFRQVGRVPRRGYNAVWLRCSQLPYPDY